jgi:WD40 repeat protein
MLSLKRMSWRQNVAYGLGPPCADLARSGRLTIVSLVVRPERNFVTGDIRRLSVQKPSSTSRTSNRQCQPVRGHSRTLAQAGLLRKEALRSEALSGLSIRKPGFRIGASFRAAFSGDGARLATVGKRVTVWDVAARTRVGSVHPFPHEASIDVSPNGERLVVKNTLGDVVVLDVESLSEELRLSGVAYGEGSPVRFSPCGEFVIDGSWNGDLLVRDAASGEVVLHESGGSITSIACSADRSHWLYTRAGAGCVTRRWPFMEFEPMVYANGDFLLGPHALAISGDGQRIVTARWQLIEAWQIDGNRLELLGEHSVATSGTGDAVAWSPAGTSIAYAGAGQALVLTPELHVVWRADFRYPSDVAYSPDGDLLAIGDWSSGAVIPPPA